MLKIIVLGSGAGGGFPQWNCACPNCRRVRAGDPAARPRTQSSLAVSADDKHWFLLNASPDLRTQIERTPALHARGEARHSPIQGAVLTNADVDHIAGLLNLRESQSLTVYATARGHATLSENSIFNVLNPEFVKRETLVLDDTRSLRLTDGAQSGITVRTFAVPGKVALYLEDPSRGNNFGTVPEDTVALRIGTPIDGKHFYYLPGCATLPAELSERLAGAPLVLFDGTTWTNDEMLTTGVGVKTGQRMGHMSMSGEDGSISAFAGLGIKNKVFVHINNTNPVLIENSGQRKQAEDAGWTVAYDGMEISL